jgi:hypothetical protein
MQYYTELRRILIFYCYVRLWLAHPGFRRRVDWTVNAFFASAQRARSNSWVVFLA